MDPHSASPACLGEVSAPRGLEHLDYAPCLRYNRAKLDHGGVSIARRPDS